MYPGRYIGASGGGLDALCWTGDVRRLKLKQRTDFAFAFTVSRQASPAAGSRHGATLNNINIPGTAITVHSR